MKFNLYYGLSDGNWWPAVENPQSDEFTDVFIPTDARERMKVGDVYIDTEGDKWERIE